jgi:hypothetical protein
VDQQPTFTHHPMAEIHCGLFVFEFFGTSVLRTLELRNFGPREFPHLFLPNLLTFKIPIYFSHRAHVVKLSPTRAVARGRSRKVHVTFGDIIGSHPALFLFQSFGPQKFVHPHILFLPIAEISKLRSTFCLI